MKTINQNTRFTEAQNTLAELTGAFNAATAEEARLLGLLAAPAAASFDPLAAGLRLLRGEPAQRNDSTGLNRELAQVRERLDTLRPAVEAQRADPACDQPRHRGPQRRGDHDPEGSDRAGQRDDRIAGR